MIMLQVLVYQAPDLNINLEFDEDWGELLESGEKSRIRGRCFPFRYRSSSYCRLAIMEFKMPQHLLAKRFRSLIEGTAKHFGRVTIAIAFHFALVSFK